jgi:hypothetical protein
VQQFFLTKFAIFSVNNFAEQMWTIALKRLIFGKYKEETYQDYSNVDGQKNDCI